MKIKEQLKKERMLNKIYLFVNRMSILFVLIILFPIVLSSCLKTKTQQLKCLNQIICKDQKSKEYMDVDQALNDSIENWIADKIETMQHYKTDIWDVDAIIFSKNKRRCFIIIIGIDTIPNACFDFADFCVGEIDNNKWNFYYGGMPSLYIPKRKPKNTLENISGIARDEIIRGGVLKKCSLNEDYIAGWFNDGLLQSQKRFLKNKVR